MASQQATFKEKLFIKALKKTLCYAKQNYLTRIVTLCLRLNKTPNRVQALRKL